MRFFNKTGLKLDVAKKYEFRVKAMYEYVGLKESEMVIYSNIQRITPLELEWCEIQKINKNTVDILKDLDSSFDQQIIGDDAYIHNNNNNNNNHGNGNGYIIEHPQFCAKKKKNKKCTLCCLYFCFFCVFFFCLFVCVFECFCISLCIFYRVFFGNGFVCCNLLQFIANV